MPLLLLLLLQCITLHIPTAVLLQQHVLIDQRHVPAWQYLQISGCKVCSDALDKVKGRLEVAVEFTCQASLRLTSWECKVMQTNTKCNPMNSMQRYIKKG